MYTLMIEEATVKKLLVIYKDFSDQFTCSIITVAKQHKKATIEATQVLTGFGSNVAKFWMAFYIISLYFPNELRQNRKKVEICCVK